MNNPKTQHWVPRLYLQNFANEKTSHKKIEKRQIHTYSKGRSEYFSPNIANVSAENFLYSPKDADGTRDWSVDTQLTKYEDIVAKVWPYFINWNLPLYGDMSNDYKNAPNGDLLRETLSVFVAQLLYRNPVNKSSIRKLANDAISEINKFERDHNGKPIAAGRWKTIENIEQYDLSEVEGLSSCPENIIESIFLNTLKTGALELAEIIYNKNWLVIEAEDGKYFLTSDRPVVKANPRIGVYGSDLYFSLSPKRCLVISNDGGKVDRTGDYFFAKSSAVDIINTHIYAKSNDQIYSDRPLETENNKIQRDQRFLP